MPLSWGELTEMRFSLLLPFEELTSAKTKMRTHSRTEKVMSATMRWLGLMSLSLVLHLSVNTSVLGMLGESTATVEQDRTILPGTLSIESKTGISVYVLEAPGMSVREYVSPEGVVFGIGWSHHAGPLSLAQLFGSYYGEYSRAVSAQPRRSLRFYRIETDHLIIERGGRMGATWGRVWLPSLLPAGVSEGRIQ